MKRPRAAWVAVPVVGVIVLAAAGALRGIGAHGGRQPSLDQRAADAQRARESQNNAATVEAEQRKTDAETRATQAEIDATNARRAEQAAEAERLMGELRALTPAERRKRLEAACAVGCSADDIAYYTEASATAPEKVALHARGTQLRAAAAVAKRRAFAAAYKDTLQERSKNVDAVEAAGADATTLRVRGWFCTREFVDDFPKKPFAAKARAEGFRKLECGNGVDSWSAEL